MDHCDAIDFLVHNGENGQVYNVGSGNERTNLDITAIILHELGKPESLKTYVADRLGHDRRYSVDTGRIRNLGWQPKHTFEEAMVHTIQWYKANSWWWSKLKTGEYLAYYKQNYKRDL